MTEKAREPRDPSDMDHPLYNPAEDPKHPFYEGEKMETEPAPSDEDGNKVGPGFPPKKHRWKKGGQSPNPKGRPKKIPSMKPDLKKALESALNEKVVITKDKKEVVMTKAILGIQQLVNQFAKGCRYARRDVFQYAVLLGIDLHAKEAIEEALGPDARAIARAYVQRQLPTSAEMPPEVRVKAPPDLVDDDVAKVEPIEQPAGPPPRTKPATMPIEPVYDENGKELRVDDIRYVREQNVRRLAWDKKLARS